MGPNKFLRILVTAVLVHAGLVALAQQDTLLARLDAWRTSGLQEKIYSHLDRTFYLTGETVWFSLYYSDAALNLPLDLSKVAYVEIMSSDNKAVLSAKVALSTGGGYGSVFLPASLASGNYVFRAYTSLMKNYSADAFFQQAITIVNPFTKLGLKEKTGAPKYDIQLFPEGGNLVSGITSKIGFRVTNSFGEGIDFNGSVINDQHDTLVRFKPLHFGLGSFLFRPVAGMHYAVIIKDHKKTITKTDFPAVLSEGYVLAVSDSTVDKIKVSVNSNAITPNAPFCYLVIHARMSAIQSKIIYISNGRGSLLIDKNSIAEGLSHFTIFNPSLLPVCERLFFKQPKELNPVVRPDASVYGKRKKVTLDVTLPAGEKIPANSRMSMAVYRMDSLQNQMPADIKAYTWLTSELKGAVESPMYYFDDANSDRYAAIDNVLLTHGWSRYNWDDILRKDQTLEFIPEYRGHIIFGKIKNLSATDRKRIVAYLSNPDRSVRLYPSRSTVNGSVQFELRQFFGTRKLIVQLNTRQDSIYDMEIMSPFSAKTSSWSYPEFDFSQTLINPITQRSLHMQVQNNFHDVNKDRFRTERFDTTAFYGIPDERYFLDDYTRFPTMEEVMREYISGVRVRNRKGNFHYGVLDNINRKVFKDDPLVLLDGVPVFDLNKIIAMDPLKVKKIEVMTRRYYLGPKAFDGIVSYTTYHGDMSDFEIDRRALITDYEGLQVYREFFSPKYESEQQVNDRVPDARTLLYWNPDIKITGEGKRQPSFYTSDIKGKYQIIVESLSVDGKPGSASATIDVK